MCPQEDRDCRHACLSSGFSSEVCIELSSSCWPSPICRPTCCEKSVAALSSHVTLLLAQAFGALLLLYSLHDGDCDCTEVFAGASESGDPVIIGEASHAEQMRSWSSGWLTSCACSFQVMLLTGSSLSFSFTDQFYASFLPQDLNSSTYTPPIGFASATLVPFEAGMILNVGGECAYR